MVIFHYFGYASIFPSIEPSNELDYASNFVWPLYFLEFIIILFYICLFFYNLLFFPQMFHHL